MFEKEEKKKLLSNKKEIKEPHWDRVFCLMRLQGQRVHPALSGISCTPTHCTFLTPRRHTHTRRLPKHTFLFSLSQQQYKRIENISLKVNKIVKEKEKKNGLNR
jgi:hypothetical protein